MTRQESNRKLTSYLIDLIEQHPDLRFGQILYNFGFVKPARAVKEPGEQPWQNEFYVEPGDLLLRVETRIKDVEGDSN